MLTDAALRRFASLLRARRAESTAERELLAASLREVRAARSDGTADDEHDPDGPTMSAEWSRVSGLSAELDAKAAAIDSALMRIAAGDYGRCIRCGREIAPERLEARPEAPLCIDCARELEQRRR